MKYPPGEENVHQHELSKILFDDCYGLADVGKPIANVLDVGANIGLFGIAARHYHRNAVIHSYEPNKALEPFLKAHCDAMKVKYHMEAIGSEAGSVCLTQNENSLHSTVCSGSVGPIRQTAFREAVRCMGDMVDLLKLDCEGAEWALFDDKEPWSKVRYLTMEYHLWANKGSTVKSLQHKVDSVGFECTRIWPLGDGSFGMLRAKNRKS